MLKQEIRNVVLVLTAAWLSLESQMPFAFHLSNLPGQVFQSPKKGNIVSGLLVVEEWSSVRVTCIQNSLVHLLEPDQGHVTKKYLACFVCVLNRDILWPDLATDLQSLLHSQTKLRNTGLRRSPHHHISTSTWYLLGQWRHYATVCLITTLHLTIISICF